MSGSKWCPKCARDLPRDAFGPNAARPDGLQAQCRVCLKGIQRVSRSRPQEAARCRRNREGQRAKLQEWVLHYLQDHPCQDCGEDDPVVLEFDHRGDKTAAIAEMVRDAVALHRLMAEIEKCAVRCANCHRRKTARDRGFYRGSTLGSTSASRAFVGELAAPNTVITTTNVCVVTPEPDTVRTPV